MLHPGLTCVASDSMLEPLLRRGMTCTAWVNTRASVTRKLKAVHLYSVSQHNSASRKSSTCLCHIARTSAQFITFCEASCDCSLYATDNPQVLKQVTEIPLYSKHYSEPNSASASRPASRVCVTHITPWSLQVVLLSQHNSPHAVLTKPGQGSGNIACDPQQTNSTLVHCQCRI